MRSLGSGRPLAFRLVVPVALWILAMTGCPSSDDHATPPSKEQPIATRSIDEVMAEHAAAWMQIPGVNTVYRGALDDGTPCIKIGVVKLDQRMKRQFPAQVEGHPIVLIESGEIRPLSGSDS
jgi:hypothetical protein